MNAIVTLLLSLSGLLAQLLLVWASPSSLWLVNAAAACSLAVVGVSGLKMLLDLKQLFMALRRRLVRLLDIRHGYQITSPLTT